MVTIKQVAVHAGVSFKTVSRVVNKDPTVKKINREKIEQSIKELGYRPNRAASLTRKKKSGIFGLIADELLSTPYTFDIIRGAQDLAWNNNKELMVLNVDEKRYSGEKAVEHLFEHRVEGIIYASMFHRKLDIPHELLNIPAVLVNCSSSQNNLPSVIPDEVYAAEVLTNKLLSKGYKRIAFLNLNENIIAAQGRKQGVINAFKQSNLPMENLYIESVMIETDDGEKSITRESTRRIINTFGPDAIICGQDPMAAEVYFVLQKMGYKVKDDIGIASFDNWEPIPSLLHPTLSTMALPHYEMGQWAMNYLLTGQTGIIEHKEKFKLIERESF
ncbi:LacI family DNA-binding transcriptional regulator [Colwellia sp. MB02u-9]|uniref:LacI family DNA-binding transcriptional regulator n=1 Tax=Colwellia sp. MB02u-9 TaxID=2759823 RepID=UPI0015F54204|nr:LacI family DNA-binding transcriptional regulator [Colwellia sp. MB02u-9]MBA6297784.1 LacI family DNA-binding transcriptional regulator [Colwellia sp. MB02u-9]